MALFNQCAGLFPLSPKGCVWDVPRWTNNFAFPTRGKTCGVCYRACPLPDLALRVGMLEQPEVLDACVGCGLCERSCIQMPQAIRIIPAHAQTGEVL